MKKYMIILFVFLHWLGSNAMLSRSGESASMPSSQFWGYIIQYFTIKFNNEYRFLVDVLYFLFARTMFLMSVEIIKYILCIC